MDEDVIFCFVVEAALGDEGHVGLGDLVGVFAVREGFHGFDAAVEGPVHEGDVVIEGFFEHFLVIAFEGDEVVGFGEFREEVEDAFGVGATVDVVAESDDGVVGLGVDEFEE